MKKLIASFVVIASLLVPTTAFADGGTAPPAPFAATNSTTTISPSN